jgi:hypothetical protein
MIVGDDDSDRGGRAIAVAVGAHAAASWLDVMLISTDLPFTR